MFFFGDPSQTAQLYWENAGYVTGPPLPRKPLDEMTEQELRNVLTYARIAYRNAQNDGAPEEVMSLLLQDHDAAFSALAEASERFRTRVRSNQCMPLTGHSAESVAKYKKLAAVAD